MKVIAKNGVFRKPHPAARASRGKALFDLREPSRAAQRWNDVRDPQRHMHWRHSGKARPRAMTHHRAFAFRLATRARAFSATQGKLENKLLRLQHEEQVSREIMDALMRGPETVLAAFGVLRGRFVMPLADATLHHGFVHAIRIERRTPLLEEMPRWFRDFAESLVRFGEPPR